MKQSLVFNSYQVLRSLRYSLLMATFGFVSHCPHTPTCGTTLLVNIKERGILSGVRTTWRQVLSCW